MQNRSAIWIFTILLAVACLYSLSFSFFTSSFEKKADAYAQEEYIDSIAQVLNTTVAEMSNDQKEEYYNKGRDAYTGRYGNDIIIPVLNYDYYDCRSRELQKGLDLEGGMSVTLEVSVPDLITKLSGNSKSESFNAAIAKAKALQSSTSGKTFIELFEETWKQDNDEGKLAKIFHSWKNKEKFPADATDEEIISILKDESEAAVSNTEKIIRTRVDQYGVTQPTIQRQQFTDRILVELPGAKDKMRIRELLKSTANLEFWELYTIEELAVSLQAINERMGKHRHPELFLEKDTTSVSEEGALSQDGTLPADTSSVANEDGTGEVTNIEELEGETPIEDDESQEEARLKNPLFAIFSPAQQAGPVIGFAQDRALVDEILNSEVVQDLIPGGEKLTWAWSPKSENNFYTLYALKVTTSDGSPRLDGEAIVNARQDFDQFSGQALVTMSMNSEGAKTWANMTREAASANPKQSIAVVLDSIVYTAPVVNQEISGGNSQITVGGTDVDESIKEAVDLANLLEAGALPAKSDIVDEQIIGASIGPENASKGLWSFVIALAVILIYMIFYYSGAGGVSDIALVANMFFLMGALVSLGASLTLPGIAGIILTIGMAVDANVLIFERIKEELRAGAGKQAAINKGYKKAYSAILDANITTFLTGLVLFIFGSGPIRGFATTLMIGIVTSLFSAIFITRLIISWRMDRKKDVSFYTAMTKNLFANNNIDFISKRKMFYGLSAVIIIAGIVSLRTNSLDFGVDFTGGRTFDIEFAEKVDTEEVREALADAFEDDNGQLYPPSVKSIGTLGNKVRITTKFLVNDNRDDVDEIIETALTENLVSVGTVLEDKFQSKKVDSTISDDFQSKSLVAIGFSLLIIFLYILLRFRKKEYGIGALVAMAHDVLVVLGLFSILYRILPFSMEIDQAFIAAILTVVGYSINDTVVVFDRLREYLSERKRGVDKDVINSALNSTLSRTVNTSMSTFIVLLMIFIFGGDSIKGFTFALMIGVIVGTYSSLCIATPLVVDLSKKEVDKV